MGIIIIHPEHIRKAFIETYLYIAAAPITPVSTFNFDKRILIDFTSSQKINFRVWRINNFLNSELFKTTPPPSTIKLGSTELTKFPIKDANDSETLFRYFDLFLSVFVFFKYFMIAFPEYRSSGVSETFFSFFGS